MPTVGLIGGGLIGRSWANVFARAGWDVRLWDADAKVTETAPALVAESLRDLAKHGLIKDPAKAAKRVSAVTTMADAVEGADFVQESGPETLSAKLDIWAKLDSLANKDIVLASSTSAIVASRFTEKLKGRARCIVAHPVNPPHLVPVVELCGAPWTSEATRKRAREVFESVGQTPVEVKKEVDGFILNRLQAAVLTEAFRLVEEGYVTPQDLDHTIADGLGLRWAFMGPFETIELNAPAGIPDYCARFGEMLAMLSRDPNAPAIWNKAKTDGVVAQWGNPLDADEVAKKSLWRNSRLAALAAHKKEQN